MAKMIIAAFMMGLLGSFHCVGMCGPIALSLPLNHDGDWGKFSGALFYNSGRVITYSAFGFIFGIIGKSVALFGYQQWLSVILGLLIIFFIIVPKRLFSFRNQNFILIFFGRLRSALGKLFLKKNFSSLFSIGLLNGLLPCGLVYMAAAVAVSTGDVANSMIFMTFFGLGTLPMMWSIAFFGNCVSIGIRQKIRKAYPYMMTLLACLLILRGMGLGIPYISPKANLEKKVDINCCARPAKN
jgi:sulfite exporter TauE/SafE